MATLMQPFKFWTADVLCTSHQTFHSGAKGLSNTHLSTEWCHYNSSPITYTPTQNAQDTRKNITAQKRPTPLQCCQLGAVPWVPYTLSHLEEQLAGCVERTTFPASLDLPMGVGSLSGCHSHPAYVELEYVALYKNSIRLHCNVWNSPTVNFHIK